MSTLHIINSAKTAEELNRLMQYCLADDKILFIQDGCYVLPIIQSLDVQQNCYVLLQDLNARNMTAEEHFQTIDYGEFVDLTLSCNKTMSW